MNWHRYNRLEIWGKAFKEFEAVGFFVSDHPLNQYKNFTNFNIIDLINLIPI